MGGGAVSGDVNAAADSRTALAWNAVEKIAESDAGGWLMEFTAANLLRERAALVAEVETLRAALEDGKTP